MTAGLVILALFCVFLVGMLAGAWLAFVMVRVLRPGREGDLLAELAALRASQSLHFSAMKASDEMWQAAREQS